MNDTDEMKEVIDEFLVESFENLDQLDNDLLALEDDPSNLQILASIFRTIHTIKGTCGFLGFGKLEKLSHVGENLLSRLRDGKLQLDIQRTSALLQMVDAIRSMLKSIEQTGNDGTEEFATLSSQLSSLLESPAARPAPEPTQTSAAITTEQPPSTEEISTDESASADPGAADLAANAAEADAPASADIDTAEADEMKEVIDEFLVESFENLDQLDNDLLALEDDPDNLDILASIFRIIHTIKGTCGFLGFGKLEKLSHVGESLLSRLREGKLQLSEERTSALLQMVDAIRCMLKSIEQIGNDGADQYPELIEKLTDLLEDSSQQSPSQSTNTQPVEPASGQPAMAANETAALDDDDVERDRVDPLGKKLVDAGYAQPTDVAKALQQQLEGDSRPMGQILIDEEIIDPEKVNSTIQDQQQERNHKRSLASSNIRVDVGLLDTLMNLVGELVLARNQILQYNSQVDDPGFSNTSQRLSMIITELQEKVMQTRMQPIGGVWSKFPRVVRDLAHGCGKQVQIVMEGKDTELDKTLIEAIKDPLTHLVRNSIDHGIEMPEQRVAKGKTAQGTLLLRAYHEGGMVNIEIIDDGGGIEPGPLLEKAVQQKRVTAEQAAKMSDKDVFNLIFQPGLSTAKKVTNISGRGVGMDVVKTNIEKIGGIIDLQSKANAGTTVRIKIPLTLAIIPALTVICENDRYAIPQVNLLELVNLRVEDAKTAIEMVHGAPVYRLRGRLLPLVYLTQELWNHPAEVNAEEGINIVVLQAGEQQFGLVVDDIDDTQEIVVKPLGRQLHDISSFAGATIMGDGNVAMILDVLGLAERAHLMAEMSHNKGIIEQTEEDSQHQQENKRMLILMSNPDGGRMAVPMLEVVRLEELARSVIERVGGREVVRYRDQIMPLIDVARTLPERRSPERVADAAASNDEQENLQVIVCSDQDAAVGLVVHQITDVIEEVIEIEGNASRQGVRGTGVVHDHVTEFIDIPEIIRMAGVL